MTLITNIAIRISSNSPEDVFVKSFRLLLPRSTNPVPSKLAEAPSDPFRVSLISQTFSLLLLVSSSSVFFFFFFFEVVSLGNSNVPNDFFLDNLCFEVIDLLIVVRAVITVSFLKIIVVLFFQLKSWANLTDIDLDLSGRKQANLRKSKEKVEDNLKNTSLHNNRIITAEDYYAASS